MIPHSRPQIDEADVDAVVGALRAGCLAEGAYVARLERQMSAMFAGRETVVTASGTAALALALAGLGVGPGREVIIPSYACRSLYAAVAYAGAAPVCADLAEDSVCIGPQQVRAVLTPMTAAVIVPHLFGFAADLAGIRALGIPVIEDCAQCLGGQAAPGAPLGQAGDVAVFSFYATKLAPAGEGGACVTADRALAARIRALRHCDETPIHPKAFNFKMSDLHAALALARLAKLPASLTQRTGLGARYDVAFGRCAWRKIHARDQAVCFRYLLELASDRLEAFLAAADRCGIACRRPVPEPLHRALGGVCPRADAAQATLVSVPLYPGLTNAEVARICGELPGLVVHI